MRAQSATRSAMESRRASRRSLRVCAFAGEQHAVGRHFGADRCVRAGAAQAAHRPSRQTRSDGLRTNAPTGKPTPEHVPWCPFSRHTLVSPPSCVKNSANISARSAHPLKNSAWFPSSVQSLGAGVAVAHSLNERCLRLRATCATSWRRGARCNSTRPARRQRTCSGRTGADGRSW